MYARLLLELRHQPVESFCSGHEIVLTTNCLFWIPGRSLTPVPCYIYMLYCPNVGAQTSLWHQFSHLKWLVARNVLLGAYAACVFRFVATVFVSQHSHSQMHFKPTKPTWLLYIRSWPLVLCHRDDFYGVCAYFRLWKIMSLHNGFRNVVC